MFTVIDPDNFPTEIFNSFDLTGLPLHLFSSKHSSCTILRPYKALRKKNNIIEAASLNESSKGDDLLFPRVPLILKEM